MKIGFNGNLRARRQWVIEDEFDDVLVLGMIFGLYGNVVCFEMEAVDVSFFVFAREVESGIAVFQQLIAEGRAVIFISIGPEVKPDECKGIGGMVLIRQLQVSVEHAGTVIQLNPYAVICLLLPVRCRLCREGICGEATE